MAPESKHVRMVRVKRESLCEGCFSGIKVAQCGIGSGQAQVAQRSLG